MQIENYKAILTGINIIYILQKVLPFMCKVYSFKMLFKSIQETKSRVLILRVVDETFIEAPLF